MSIVGTNEIQDQENASVLVVIREPFAYLQKEMEEAFKDRQNIRIITDRRKGNRKLKEYPFGHEIRRTYRRTSDEEMAQVIIHI
jgi:hypothetical protein